MTGTEGENAESNQLGEMLQSRVTLKIWDVPPELAQKFVRTAKSSYANKSWLLLQDIMKKADQYDEFISSGRLQDHETRIANLESILAAAVEDEPAQEKTEEPKVPKTFGRR